MFKDRKNAALHLAKALEKYRSTDAVVLGIPRGGAETAYYVAKELGLDLSLLVCRKLGHPYNPEYAIGALAEDGSLYLSSEGQQEFPRQVIEDIIQEQKKEIERRIQLLRKGRPLPSLNNKTVILVDDGIATGATLYASIELCKHQKASRIVIAAPISGREKKNELSKVADEVVILETPNNYQAVSQGYESFNNLSDIEALGFMEKWEAERQTAH